MKGWKKFSLWAGLSSSYANAVTFLYNSVEVSTGLLNYYDMNDMLDGKCNIHGSILNPTEEFPRNLLSEVRDIERELQKDLKNRPDLKLQAVWDSLLSHPPGVFRQDTLENLETITFWVTKTFPKVNYCRLTDKHWKTHFTNTFDFTLGRTKKGPTVNIKWPDEKSITSVVFPARNDAMLDVVARGAWCSLKLRGLDLPRDAVVGYISDENCLVTVVFDANINDVGELVVRNNNASYMIGDEGVKRTIDIGAEGSALLTMSNEAADKYCKNLLKDTHGDRFALFNTSISGNCNFMVTFNFLLPYGYADLKELSIQVNRIDKLSDRLQENVNDDEAACQLMACINEVREAQKVADLRRFEWITTKAYNVVHAFHEFLNGNSGVVPKCKSVKPPTADSRQMSFSEALQILKGSN
eukprot:GHVS01053636.1.p1 GENE.GHVS01053636.1~~GHVS01053636.1.p1  ORF type:complete len:412 (+),score=31.60 GHVS01053636.1:100-1335(+)